MAPIPYEVRVLVAGGLLTYTYLLLVSLRDIQGPGNELKETFSPQRA